MQSGGAELLKNRQAEVNKTGDVSQDTFIFHDSARNNIVVLENGRVTEEGTHRELMGRRGVYWNLYKTQEDMQ